MPSNSARDSQLPAASLATVESQGRSLSVVPDGSFDCVLCVLCSQVIEHVPREPAILRELERILVPGGRLVLGTSDHANWEWRATERLYGFFAPGGYADEYIGHYRKDELVSRFLAARYSPEAVRYILKGELILALRQPQGGCP